MSALKCDLSRVYIYCCVYCDTDLRKESIKSVYERHGGKESERCGVLRDKSNSSGAQATASGGKQCPFCPNKPHQDSWHEVWGIDISSRYAVCCPPALGKEKRWFNLLHCPHCCWSWAPQQNLRTFLILFSPGWLWEKWSFDQFHCKL